MDKAQAISVKELLKKIGHIDGELTRVTCAGPTAAREHLRQARVMVREMMERVESGIVDAVRPPIPADAACDVHTVTHPRTDNPRPERTMYPSLPSGDVQVTHATRPSPEAKTAPIDPIAGIIERAVRESDVATLAALLAYQWNQAAWHRGRYEALVAALKAGADPEVIIADLEGQ